MNGLATSEPLSKRFTNKNSFVFEDLIDCANGKLFGLGNAQLPAPPMLMFNRITHINSEGGAYGKAIFVVRPVDTDQRCQIQVKTSDGRDSVDCNTEYLVACDIDIPLDQPFCQLVRELGVERDSVYPATRRK